MLFESEHVVVVRKPATVPVHPIGRFKRCSLTELTLCLPELAATKNVWLCNRLDRLVSGCIVLAKEKQTSSLLMQCFVDGNVKKKYARAKSHPARACPRTRTRTGGQGGTDTRTRTRTRTDKHRPAPPCSLVRRAALSRMHTAMAGPAWSPPRAHGFTRPVPQHAFGFARS